MHLSPNLKMEGTVLELTSAVGGGRVMVVATAPPANGIGLMLFWTGTSYCPHLLTLLHPGMDTDCLITFDTFHLGSQL